MTGFASLLLILAALTQATVQQKASGWCSPPIANVTGNVTIICQGVDPKALTRLNDELSRRKQELGQKIREANDWAEKYFELEKRLSEATGDGQQSQLAEKYIHEGDLEKAEAILNTLLQRGEEKVDTLAANHFNMGLILDLRFEPGLALGHFEKAYRYRPDNVTYAHQYARHLQIANRDEEARAVYEKNLPLVRNLAKSNPPTYLPLEAKTLQNIGLAFANEGNSKEAAQRFREAVDLYERLADADPSNYLLLQANTLEELGGIYQKTGLQEQAERCYDDALAKFKQVSMQPGGAYRVEAAVMLDHLGEHYAEMQNTKHAETIFNEALSIARRLADENEPWVLGLVLEHLADFNHNQLHNLDQAENAYKESLSIFRRLSNSAPVYLLLQASAAHNLGALYSETGKFDEAVNCYQAALTLLRTVSKDNATSSVPFIAVEQYSLGLAYMNLGRLDQAEQADQEAISVYQQLSANETKYLPQLAGTLGNLGDAYRRGRQPSLALKAYQDALQINRRLAAGGLNLYSFNVAMTLNTLGAVCVEAQDFPGAIDYYTQSLRALGDLSKAAGETHPREHAWVLSNLAGIGVQKHLPSKKALKYADQAIKIQRNLWRTNQSTYGNDLAGSLMEKAQLLGIQGSHHREGCSILVEAQQVASSEAFKQIPKMLYDASCASAH